jgi:hypothetical protein
MPLAGWHAAQVEARPTNAVKMPAVAEAAGDEVYGGTAMEMEKDARKELGATGVDASKVALLAS